MNLSSSLPTTTLMRYRTRAAAAAADYRQEMALVGTAAAFDLAIDRKEGQSSSKPQQEEAALLVVLA